MILLVFEWGLRSLLKMNPSLTISLIEFTGPALSASALTFLIPLTKPKIFPINIEGNPGVFATTSRDSQLIAFTWLLVFIFLFAWAGSCYMSMAEPSHKIWLVNTHLVIGLLTYFLSLIMTFVKEKI